MSKREADPFQSDRDKRLMTSPQSSQPSIPSTSQQFSPSLQPFIDFQLIETLETKYNERFLATEQWTRYEVRHNLNKFPDLMTIQTSIDDAYERVMKPYIEDSAPSDIIGGYVEHEALQYHISFRPIKVKNFDKREFLNRIFSVSQSRRQFLLDGTLIFRVVVYKSLTGSGRGTKAPLSYSEADDKKRSIIRIENNDKSCGYQAIAMGILYHEWKVKGNSRNTNWYNLINKKRTTKRKKEMLRFCWKYRLNHTHPLDMDILKKLDSHSDFHYQIIVIKDCQQMFVGTDRPKVIYLLYSDKHFDLITSMPAYTGDHYYCKYCNMSFRRAAKHRCENSCFYCRSHHPCITTTSQHCSNCNFTFVSPECFEHHIESGICQDRQYCSNCEVGYIVDRKHKHKCEEWHCHTCGLYYTVQPHYCYMTPLEEEKITEEDKKHKVMIAYDIECMLEQAGQSFKHTPILIISHIVCDFCVEFDTCDICVKREWSFYGSDCVQNFVQFLLDFSKTAEKKKSSITVFAHNNSGYDGHWVLRELARRNIKGLDGTLNGTKILKLDAGNIRFIDSLLLFHRPLADLPKMFGFEGEVKGFFSSLSQHT